MEEVEIMIDGKKVKTISKLSKEEIDDNSMRLFLDGWEKEEPTLPDTVRSHVRFLHIRE